jgi:DNA-binding response OmpR family regulator
MEDAPASPARGAAPVFVLVDDDRDASSRIALVLPGDWFLVPVAQPALAVRYAKQFRPTAVLLAEPLEYPRGGAARVLQELLDGAGRPVIILTEDASPHSAARWRRMGASACIPHPTRSFRRMHLLQETLKASIAAGDPGGAIAAALRFRAVGEKRR